MNRLSVINNTKTLVIPLLAVLLLLAPCSLRNNLENNLRIASTKPLNPNKTANTCSVNCSITVNTAQKQRSAFSKKEFTKFSNDNFALFTSVNKGTAIFVEVIIPNASPPYYILYKRLKIYDLNKAYFV